MDRHPEFHIAINEDPQNSAMCVVGFHLLPPGEKRISTYIGTSGQNDVCFGCLADLNALVKGKRTETRTVASDARSAVSA